MNIFRWTIFLNDLFSFGNIFIVYIVNIIFILYLIDTVQY